MIELLKILHVFAFTAGIGGSLANLVVIRAAGSADPEAVKVLRGITPRIGVLSVHSLGLLWVTGPLLLWLAYNGGAHLGPLFHAKMLGAVLLTLIVIASRMTIRKIKAGKPAPLASHMPKLALAASLTGLTTIALAVLTFS
ncbi:hypothetical protein DYI23_08820 [Roseibium polysiphoniae]|uniref:Uncharacterized protein n=1 Tax=Roseibium polysiphoniae TaxID=2571221 RepID=A0A944GSM5_9HYPH|nr:hypothetical protein [Roseibium polysiphoniae]MBS8260317.1 hypothetical protein [Roseibium polysiphoniae]